MEGTTTAIFKAFTFLTFFISRRVQFDYTVKNLKRWNLQEFQRFIFCRFHDLALSRAFVVDATEVQDAVDDDAMELLVVGLMEELGIGADGI